MKPSEVETYKIRNKQPGGQKVIKEPLVIVLRLRIQDRADATPPAGPSVLLKLNNCCISRKESKL